MYIYREREGERERERDRQERKKERKKEKKIWFSRRRSKYTLAV